MNMHSAPDDEFERWVEDRLDTQLGGAARGAAPGDPRYRSQAGRRFAMAPLHVALAVGAALLAIGGSAAYAAGIVHGTSVSQAAHACATSPSDAHGDCVVTVAHSTTTSSSTTSSSTHTNNDTHGDLVSNAAHTCPTSPPGAHGQCVSNVASGGKSGGKGNAGGGGPPGNSRH